MFCSRRVYTHNYYTYLNIIYNIGLSRVEDFSAVVVGVSDSRALHARWVTWVPPITKLFSPLVEFRVCCIRGGEVDRPGVAA